MNEPADRGVHGTPPAPARRRRRMQPGLLRVAVFSLTVIAMCFTAVAVHAMCLPDDGGSPAVMGTTAMDATAHHPLTRAANDAGNHDGPSCSVGPCQALPGHAPAGVMMCLALLTGVVLSLLGLLNRPGPLAAWRWLVGAPDPPSWPGHLPAPRPPALAMLSILRT